MRPVVRPLLRSSSACLPLAVQVCFLDGWGWGLGGGGVKLRKTRKEERQNPKKWLRTLFLFSI